MALFVVMPVLGPVLAPSASSVFSGPLTLVLSSPLPDLPPATSPRESELPSPASLCWPEATITVLDFELSFPLVSPLPLTLALTSEPEVALALLAALALVSLLALTSLPALTLVSLLALASELTDALPLALACRLALTELAAAGLLDLASALGRAWSLASGSTGLGAGALLEALSAGAGAGALLEAIGAGAGAGALEAFGAGWLLEPPFALFLSPSPLPPIWWSLL